MKTDRPFLPEFFKGIALFTPGGDLIYCIDSTKQTRWHLQLCVALQEILGLSEPPHFLVPCYTATVDRWLDPASGQLRVAAEAYPPVMRYQTLLNAIFDSGNLVWHARSDETCNPLAIATYYEQFPELWENHELVVKLAVGESQSHSENLPATPDLLLPKPPPARTLRQTPSVESSETRGYVLRLFVSGNNPGTERTLQTLHELLESSIGHPYTLKVIDVLKHPEQAEEDQISATPTLIKVWPKPVRRIVGEFNDVDKIVRLLSAAEF